MAGTQAASSSGLTGPGTGLPPLVAERRRVLTENLARLEDQRSREAENEALINAIAQAREAIERFDAEVAQQGRAAAAGGTTAPPAPPAGQFNTYPALDPLGQPLGAPPGLGVPPTEQQQQAMIVQLDGRSRISTNGHYSP